MAQQQLIDPATGLPVTQQPEGDWFDQQPQPPQVAASAPAAAAPQPPQGVSLADLNSIQGEFGNSLDPSNRDAVMSGRMTLDEFRRREMARATGPGDGLSAPSGGGDAAANGGAAPSGGPAPYQPFGKTFHAPTMEEVTGRGGFQFKLGNALQAIERTGLRNGTYFTNRTAGALQEQAGNMASDEYGKEYDRAFNEFNTEADIWDRNQNAVFGTSRANRLDDQGILDSNRTFDLTKTNADRSYGLAADNQQFTQGRANTTDSWSRGLDVWNIGRTEGQDKFSNDMTIGEFLQKYKPRPA
jgi:hypothetical protein